MCPRPRTSSRRECRCDDGNLRRSIGQRISATEPALEPPRGPVTSPPLPMSAMARMWTQPRGRATSRRAGSDALRRLRGRVHTGTVTLPNTDGHTADASQVSTAAHSAPATRPQGTLDLTTYSSKRPRCWSPRIGVGSGLRLDDHGDQRQHARRRHVQPDGRRRFPASGTADDDQAYGPNRGGIRRNLRRPGCRRLQCLGRRLRCGLCEICNWPSSKIDDATRRHAGQLLRAGRRRRQLRRSGQLRRVERRLCLRSAADREQAG